MSSIVKHVVVMLAMGAAACAAGSRTVGATEASSSSVPQADPPASAVTTPIPIPGPGEWQTWSRAKKFAYMKTTFMNAERALFTSWQPVRFRDFECRTCHGSAAVANGTFLMPNPDLPHVAPGADGFKELAAHEPDVLKFMQSRLVPETARLLGMPAFDFEKHTGFSCYQCHVRISQ